MFSPAQPLEPSSVAVVPREAGVYIIYDLAGAIYVGRSRVSIRSNVVLVVADGLGSATPASTWTSCRGRAWRRDQLGQGGNARATGSMASRLW